MTKVAADTRSDHDATAVSPAELLKRAEALVPLLRANGPVGEQLRHLPDESVDAVEAAGLFQMLRLDHRGGFGTDPATVAKIMTLIAGGDASVAWVMQVTCGIARLAEVLPEQALAEVYDSPRPLMAGSFAKPGGKAVPVEGGFRMVGGGSWGYVSGCHHAHSALMRLQVDEADGSVSDAFCLIPMSDLTIEDDWLVMGASGTGSNTVTCGDIFIPDYRLSRETGKAFGSLRGGTLGFAFTAMMPLGLARYALELYLELAHSRGITMLGYEKMTDSPLVQTAVATAHLNIKLMEAYQFWLLSTLEPGAEPLTDEMLPGAMSAACYKLSRQAIEAIYEICPTDEIRLSHPLQRCLRDLHAFTHQGAMAPYINYEKYGKFLCGGEAVGILPAAKRL
jgi:alkylation response protein AidB-like acyl-CoA dehydrogenase